MPQLGLGLSPSKSRLNASGSSNISQIIITGATGVYSFVNGTYEQNEYGSDFYYYGSLLINSGNLTDENEGIYIATNNNGYAGSWTPAQYLSTVTLSGAGDSAVDGTYTRTETSYPETFITFNASGGKSLTWDSGNSFWYTISDFYRNYNSVFDDSWQLENGEEPLPTVSYSSSNRNTGPITSTTVS